MSDYIKRQDAIEALCDICEALLKQSGAGEVAKARRGKCPIIKAIPSADVMPVRHGRWIKSKAGGVFCSECYSYAPNVEKGSFTTRRIEQEKSAYCPNCGAKMDGGDNE